MPAGVIPKKDDYLLHFRSRQGQESDDEKPGVLTVRLAIGKKQDRLLGVLAYSPKTGDGFFWLFWVGRSLDQPQGVFRLRPGRGVGLGKA